MTRWAGGLGDLGLELRQVFLESSREFIQLLNESGLRLERDPSDAEALQAIRRALHTLKGDSNACGAAGMARSAHDAETALQNARPEECAKLALDAADHFALLLESLEIEGQPASEAPEEAAANARPAQTLEIRIQLDEACPDVNLARQMLGRVLAECGNLTSFHLAGRELVASLQSDFSREEIIGRCQVPLIASVVTIAPAAPHRSPPLETAVRMQSEPLRVDADRVDQLINLTGELMVVRSRFNQLLKEYAGMHPRSPLRSRLQDAVEAHSRILKTLQNTVIQLRMVPVSRLFRRMPRVLRDAAQMCGKRAELEVRGGETELDRSILDAIAEPVLHMVRNAVAHGIEPEETRTLHGKPAIGRVVLSAFHNRQQVVVELRDDGFGLDSAKLISSAVAKGLLTAEEAASVSTQQANQLIFEPGVSTAITISELSGRGVGMDVVKSVVERLQGTLEVETKPGVGTAFRIRVPLSLTIVRGLLFRCGAGRFAVPIESVVELVRCRREEIQRDDPNGFLVVRGRRLQLVRIHETVAATFVAMVLSVGGETYALAVDRVLREEDLVIKGVHDPLVQSECIAGAAVLGDGGVALLLNVPALRGVPAEFEQSPALPCPELASLQEPS